MNLATKLALAQAALALAASIGYACAGDWRRAIYWAAATTITLSVTL